MNILSAAYALPDKVEAVSDILLREKERVERALRPLKPDRKTRIMDGLGIKKVRVCGDSNPYSLALRATKDALKQAGVSPKEIDLIIDYSTMDGNNPQLIPLSNRLASELEMDDSLNLSFKIGGCAGLHLAFKTASALLQTNQDLETALLICADSPPEGSRSLLPMTIQSDAGSAILLHRDSGGPLVLGSEVRTIGYLYDTIMIQRDHEKEVLSIEVNTEKIEMELKPIYYIHFYRLIQTILEKHSLSLASIDYFIYSNLNRTDQEGFIKAMGIQESKVFTDNLADLGHTFASDLIVNYCDLQQKVGIRSGQLLLFASAGVGFTWGVTLVRA